MPRKNHKRRFPVQYRVANYTVNLDDDGSEIQFDSASAVTANLPAVTDATNGFALLLRNIGTANLTIDPNGSELIDGASTSVLAADQWRWIRSDGTGWKTISRYVPTGIAETSGTWTPEITFQTPGDLSVSYSTNAGNWVKQGSLVTASFNLGTSSFTHTTASGDLQMTGIPFTGTSGPFTGALLWGGINKANFTQIATNVPGGVSHFDFRTNGMGQSVTTIVASEMPTGGTVFLIGSVTYRTAS